MRKLFLLPAILMLLACKKEIEVNSIDQIPGLWRWESTCGGPGFECIYGSKTNYATIEITSDGSFTEKHNDTLFYKTTCTIQDIDGTMGTLIFSDPPLRWPIAIMDNMLLITKDSFIETYSKIK